MPLIGEIGRNKNYMKAMWMACPDCGHEHWVRLHNGKPKSVGRCRPCRINQKMMKRDGSNNGRWKGGRVVMSGGYIGVNLTPDDFFFAMIGDKRHGHYVLEHRLAMAKYINRCLLPWEVVHHKNGNRQDNCIENLELLSGASRHMPSIKLRTEINKRDKKIARLESQITQLEAENILLKSRGIPL